jgi:hypothetical protein
MFAWRLPRRVMALIEKLTRLGAVVVDWDGRPTYQVCHRTTCREKYCTDECVARDCAHEGCWDPEHVVGVAEYVAVEVEARLQRRLTKQERRAITHELAPQLEAARRFFLDHGWERVRPAPDDWDVSRLDVHARWLARRLLGESYRVIARGEDEDGRPVTAFRVRRVCKELARTLGLSLP